MSKWFREYQEAMTINEEAIGSLTMFDVIFMYMQSIEGTPHTRKFPALDYDHLADAITKYLGDEYTLDNYKRIYAKIMESFRIYG